MKNRKPQDGMLAIVLIGYSDFVVNINYSRIFPI